MGYLKWWYEKEAAKSLNDQSILFCIADITYSIFLILKNFLEETKYFFVFWFIISIGIFVSVSTVDTWKHLTFNEYIVFSVLLGFAFSLLLFFIMYIYISVSDSYKQYMKEMKNAK